jgi:hypothetical protein
LRSDRIGTSAILVFGQALPTLGSCMAADSGDGGDSAAAFALKVSRVRSTLAPPMALPTAQRSWGWLAYGGAAMTAAARWPAWLAPPQALPYLPPASCLTS